MCGTDCRAACERGLECPCATPTGLPEGVHVLRLGDGPTNGNALKFEGAAYGANISFFAVTSRPGAGPDLHAHPYAEVWVVRRGRATFRADGQDILAGPGDVVVVEATIPHKFTSVGDEPLDMVCIHDSGRIVQRMLTETPASEGAPAADY